MAYNWVKLKPSEIPVHCMSKGTLRVLLILARDIDSDQCTSLNYEQIARDCGLDVRSIYRAIKDLVYLKLVRVISVGSNRKKVAFMHGVSVGRFPSDNTHLDENGVEQAGPAPVNNL
jgi:hypothetical protein